MAIFRSTSTRVATTPGITVVDGEHPQVRDLIQDAVTARGRAGTGGGTSTAGETTAAASASSSALPSANAAGIALLLFVPAVVLAMWILGDEKGPTFTAAEGIGAFALFYVVAQAVERFVEMVMPLCEKIVGAAGGTPKSTLVEDRDAAVATAVRTLNESGVAAADADATAAAEAQAKVDQARANRTLIAFGGSAALGMLLCAYLGADFLTTIGVEFVSGDGEPNWPTRLVMVAVTGLVVGGGAKQLNDTISTISKSSAQKSTPSETGGTK